MQRSASPTVLQYRAIERWNGALPAMNGGGALPVPATDVSGPAGASSGEN